MKLLIVDDESNARSLMARFLNAYPNMEFEIFEASDVESAIEVVKSNEPALILLDIQMPGPSGLELINRIEIKHYKPSIVFVTAYSQYAVEAFKQQALDYILKPIDQNDLHKSLDRAIKQIQSNEQAASYEQVKQMFKKLKVKKLALEVPGGYKFVDPNNILYFQAEAMYTVVKLKQGEDLKIAKPLKYFVEQISEEHLFFKPQRSYFINLNFVKEVKRGSGMYIVMVNGKMINLSKDKKEVLMELMASIF